MTLRRVVGLVLMLALVAIPSLTLRADVRSDQRTKIEFAGMLGRMFNLFGGKAAREGTVSTVAVKGNRKATLNETTGQIIDLSEEKIYTLDMKKKTYRVTTFAELRRQMEEAQRRAAEEMKKEEAQARPQAKPQASAEKEPQVEVDFDVKNTGQRKSVNGFDTRQAIVIVTVREKGKTLEQNGGLVMTTDMWLTPSIKQMDEAHQFDMKYAQKLYGPVVSGVPADQMATVMAMYPMMKDAIAKMNAEGGKIEGTAVMTVMTVEAVKSAEQLAAEANQQQGESKQEKAPTSVGGFLGGLAKKAAAKKAGGDEPAKPRATVMTATTEILKVVSDVKPEDVAVPAGFKEAK